MSNPMTTDILIVDAGPIAIYGTYCAGRFFSEPLPGRGAPLGDPGGAGGLGDLGVD